VIKKKATQLWARGGTIAPRLSLSFLETQELTKLWKGHQVKCPPFWIKPRKSMKEKGTREWISTTIYCQMPISTNTYAKQNLTHNKNPINPSFL